MSQCVAVIPARMAASRLPGKPLLDIHGTPMIVRVARIAQQAACVDRVIVATDDERIRQAVKDAGFKAWMTDPDHQTGTDRIAEVARELDAPIVINVQGDEPMLKPETIDAAAEPVLADPSIRMGTCVTPIRTTAEIFEPSCVKVIVDRQGFAQYFSRSPIPFVRDGEFTAEAFDVNAPGAPVFYKHIGIYVYRRDFLLEFTQMAPGRYEKAERLEQLRALEAGVRISAPVVDQDVISVDTPAELDRVRELLSGGGVDE